MPGITVLNTSCRPIVLMLVMVAIIPFKISSIIHDFKGNIELNTYSLWIKFEYGTFLEHELLLCASAYSIEMGAVEYFQEIYEHDNDKESWLITNRT